ncbi:acyl-CoA dehydrogenase family protein [Microbacterium sp. JZ31]|uniref:acyl-CoA dehydrogenase family protein n=1 Tax=Microbacterium sp. JZ31 TaxID=1906274 RepID=UPI0019346400|nr:acyl-CoA dehydrogenase family protein [Microbacterium sp. JZ31]
MSAPPSPFAGSPFADILQRIADGAVERERERTLPTAELDELRRAGFGALRVPPELGGAGLSLPELAEHLLALADADSNVAHALRGHFAQVEVFLARPASAHRDAWLRRIADGAIIGNAASETAGATLADLTTTLEQDDDGRWLLTGRKFYTTGTLYATHVLASAARPGEGGDRERVTVLVPTDAPGVEIVDDWDGIGQRLTASGTTVFHGVEVDPADVTPYAGGPSLGPAFFQFFLVAVVAGIGRATAREAAAYLRGRRRTFITAGADLPADDPQLQQIVGDLSGAAFAASAVTLAAAAALDRARAVLLDPASDPEQRGDVVDAAEIAVYRAQVEAMPRVIAAASELFELGGATAASRPAALDRHWRNARTVASHNPIVYKRRQIGQWELDRTSPNAEWRKLWIARDPAA